MNLIEPGTKGLAKRLNLTYFEAENLMKKMYKLPEKKQTWEVMEQLAQEMKSI